MKKKLLMVVVAVAVILIPTYVGTLSKDKADNVDRPVNAEPQKGGENKGITVNKLEIVYVEQDKAEELLGMKYTTIRELKGYKVITVGNETYLYIGLGEKPTGGYGLEVISLEDNEGILNVEIKVIQPGPDDIVTQALTYPHKILKLNFTPREVNIKATNSQDAFIEARPEGVSEY